MSTPMPVSGVAQTQSSVVIAPPPQEANNRNQFQQQKYKSCIRGLAIAEILLGVLCVILGAAISGIVGEAAASYRNRYLYHSYSSSYYSYYYYRSSFTTGEGIWCGIWIIIAGALGVHAGKQYSTRCAINTHLAFSVIASIFSGVMIILGSITAVVAYYSTLLVVLSSILSVAAFASMILHILSASYCCAAVGCCSSAMSYHYCPTNGYNGQVVYTSQPMMRVNGAVYAQQPAFQIQGVPNVQQGYVLHGAQPMVQSNLLGSVPTASTAQPNQIVTPAGQTYLAATDSKAQEALVDLPPRYDAA